MSISNNEIRFSGQYHDRETGLYYNWHRYYKPTLGRYYQADPLSKKDQIEEFSYASSNPINNSNPLGLFRTDYQITTPLSTKDDSCLKTWAKEYKVNENLYRCIIWVESSNKAADPNPAHCVEDGALGECKRKIPCFKGIKNRCDSFRCGAYYLSWCGKTYPGLFNTIMCYRGGPGAIINPQKYVGSPTYERE